MRASAGLHLHTSNRLEHLSSELAGIAAHSLGTVFQPEIVVVQSAGMGRWLSLRLAEAHGICANVQFPFPQKFIADIFRLTLPDTPAASVFDREILTWRIMHRLPVLIDAPEFEEVRHYLAGERAELKHYQLAARIAHAFDQYLVFRPQMILDWEQGTEAHWQAILWRHLSQEVPEAHQAVLGRKLAAALRIGGATLSSLPRRVSIFGISTLPGFYLELIEALAAAIEIHLFVLEPTAHWWREIVSKREAAKILRRQPRHTAKELHLDPGNPLLASWGKLGRDFLALLADLEPLTQQESFLEPAGLTMLSEVQRDIFHLREHEAAFPFWPNDRSLQFHSCHSPMRELEVLHDQLLALFERDPALQPKDVIVMMPDIASYAPFIEAVFDTPEDEKQRIPFTIADRSARAENGIAATLLAILDLASSRFAASSVLNILESTAVQRRFDLSATDLETIQTWLDKAAIRWGIDAAHREKFDLPASGQNSWREGLDRLLLGYALPAHGRQLFKGILPVDDIEGRLGETLGNFVAFMDALFAITRAVERPQTLEQWQALLRDMVERFFAPPDEAEPELSQVRRVLDSLGQISRDSAFTGAVPLEVMVAHLTRTFENTESTTGFLLGAVTFCALKPMRSIPFRVICLIGMNDTAYPRKSATIGFDLVAQHPKAGDRSVRDDDRYLFLEALLSARDVLYISYVGQSIKDNSPLPPSVLVSELLDHVRGGDDAAKLVTLHRLQPFNADYFRRDAKLFSYSADNCRAAGIARHPRIAPPPFCSAPIAAPEEEWRVLELRDLIAFFRNPAQFFLKPRLGIDLPKERAEIEDREPFTLNSLAQYKIAEDLLAQRLSGVSLEGAELLVRAGGQLPPGATGEARYSDLRRAVEEFGRMIEPYGIGARCPPRRVDLTIGGWQLGGTIDGLTTKGLLCYLPTTMKPKHMLRVWINHLAFNCSDGLTSTLLCQDVGYVFNPVQNAPDILGELLALYWRGLREPLPFFPRSSYAFAAQTVQPKGGKRPIEKATAEWEGSAWSAGGREKGNPEKNDDYFDLAFRNTTPLSRPEFPEIALSVFRPLLEARSDMDL